MSGGPKPHPPQPPVELPTGVEHGGFRAYQAYGCRCGKCQEHSRSYARRLDGRRRVGRIPEDKHGTVTGYNYYRCRCDRCRDARAEYEWKRRNGTGEN